MLHLKVMNFTESRITVHIIIYTVINASRLPPTFLPSYMGKGTQAGISETILRTQRLHNKINLPVESGKAHAPSSLQASGCGNCALQSTLTLLVPGNAGLGLSRPGGPGTAPPWHLYCAQKLGHKTVVSLLLDLAKSVFYRHCLQVSKAQVTDDK